MPIFQFGKSDKFMNMLFFVVLLCQVYISHNRPVDTWAPWGPRGSMTGVGQVKQLLEELWLLRAHGAHGGHGGHGSHGGPWGTRGPWGPWGPWGPLELISSVRLALQTNRFAVPVRSWTTLFILKSHVFTFVMICHCVLIYVEVVCTHVNSY